MIELLHQICDTIIRFCVNVPVFSTIIIEVDPKVSTASKFLTKQFFVAILLAVRVKQTTTVGNKPSGTCAIIKLIKKMIALSHV
jgi:hypothetical protein